MKQTDDHIRACIREELQRIERSSNNQLNQVSNQTLVERTRSLIRSSASSASQTLANNESPRNSQNNNRLVDCESNATDYSLTESMILVKGECDLKSTYSEDEIRSELTDLFKVKLPLITKKDFDFVRRERNTITTPIVKAYHQWDFKHVKHLCGQGKLYVRLNVIKEILVDNDKAEDSDDMAGSESATDASETVDARNVNSVTPPINIFDDQEPSTSGGDSFFDESLANLRAVFPEEDPGVLRDTLMRYEDVHMAAQVVSDKAEITMSGAENDESVEEVLKRLKKEMKSEGNAEKLKVDEEDLAVDFFQYYKNNNVDPKTPIKVQLRGQPGIDSGGILRQAFSTIFALLARNEFLGLRLFTGSVCRLTPVYSSECILTGVFEIIGRMISHSLIQNGPGFPYFTPAVYSYIATGNLEEAISKVSVIDIADPDLVEFVGKVKTKFALLILFLLLICGYAKKTCSPRLGKISSVQGDTPNIFQSVVLVC